MQIAHKDRPTDIIVKKYTDKLEEFLSTQNLSVKVELFNQPFERKVTLNDKIHEYTMVWFDHIIISGPQIEELVISLYSRASISEDEDYLSVWNDAYEIQNHLYHKLNKDRDDQYWKLWDHLRS